MNNKKSRKIVTVEFAASELKTISDLASKHLSESDSYFIDEHDNGYSLQLITTNYEALTDALAKVSEKVQVSENKVSDNNLADNDNTRQLIASLGKKGAKLGGIKKTKGAGSSSKPEPKKAASKKAEKSKTKSSGSSDKKNSYLCSETRTKIAEGSDWITWINYPFTDLDKQHVFKNLINEIYESLSSSSISALWNNDYDPDIEIPEASGNCKSGCVPVYVLELGQAKKDDVAKVDPPSAAGVTSTGLGIEVMSVDWTLWEICVKADKLPAPNPDGAEIGGEHEVQLGGGATIKAKCKNPSRGDLARDEIEVVRSGVIGFDKSPYITRAKKRAIQSALFEAAHFGLLFLKECEMNCPEKTVVSQFGPIEGGMDFAGYTWNAVDRWKVWGTCRWYVERVCG